MIYKLENLTQLSNPLTAAISNLKQSLLGRTKRASRVYDDCPYLPEDGNSENIRAIGYH